MLKGVYIAPDKTDPMSDGRESLGLKFGMLITIRDGEDADKRIDDEVESFSRQAGQYLRDALALGRKNGTGEFEIPDPLVGA